MLFLRRKIFSERREKRESPTLPSNRQPERSTMFSSNVPSSRLEIGDLIGSREGAKLERLLLSDHRRLVNKHANAGPRKSITSSSVHPSRSILLSSRSGHQRYPSDDTVTISSRPWTGNTSTESLPPRWCGNPRTSYQLARTKGAPFWTTASAPFCASLSLSLSISSPIERALVQGNSWGEETTYSCLISLFLSHSHSLHPRGRWSAMSSMKTLGSLFCPRRGTPSTGQLS